ncbi:MAG: hypothetical protein ACFFD4_15690, partial [Candidatus Odinarchaeota archaeon]
EAKLKLLDADIEQARSLLIQAQSIAMEKGLDRLALVIKNEMKKLEDKLPEWLLENSSFIDRLGRINLEGLIVSMRQNRVENFGLVEQQPVSPSMQDLKAFVDELGKRKISW